MERKQKAGGSAATLEADLVRAMVEQVDRQHVVVPRTVAGWRMGQLRDVEGDPYREYHGGCADRGEHGGGDAGSDRTTNADSEEDAGGQATPAAALDEHHGLRAARGGYQKRAGPHKS